MKKLLRLFSHSSKVFLGIFLGIALIVSGTAFANGGLSGLNPFLSLPPQMETGDILTADDMNRLINGVSTLDTRTQEIKTDGVSGNVAIGKNVDGTTPKEKLDVQGAVKVGSTTGTNTGSIRYENGDFEGYTADGWKSLTKGSDGSSGKCESVLSGSDFGTGFVSASCSSGAISYSAMEWQSKTGKLFPSFAIQTNALANSASVDCLGNACRLHLICCSGGAGGGDGTTNDTLSKLTCTDGEVAKWNNRDRKWICSAPGTDTWTTLEGSVYRASGNVGIGSTSPAEKLDVAGNVKATGFCLGNDCKTSWNQVVPTLPNCTTGQVLKSDGTQFLCIADVDTKLSEADILALGFIKTFTETDPAWNTAKENYYLKTETDAKYPLKTDVYTKTEMDASLGLFKAFAKVDLPNCTTGQVLKSDGTQFLCIADIDTKLSEAEILALGFIKTFTETDPKVGTNTTNFLSKWNGSNLTSSGVFDSGLFVGIGTTIPLYSLDITGTLRFTGNSSAPTPVDADDIATKAYADAMKDNLGNHTATTNLNMSNNKIVAVSAPTANTDAANKAYVDGVVSAGSSSNGGGRTCYYTKDITCGIGFSRMPGDYNPGSSVHGICCSETTFDPTGMGAFVLSLSTFSIYDMSLPEANAFCLTELQNKSWKGKSNYTLSSANVKAWTCAKSSAGVSYTAGCQNPVGNKYYYMAAASDFPKEADTIGGTTISSSGDGRFLFNNAQRWSDLSAFGKSIDVAIGSYTPYIGALWRVDTNNFNVPSTSYSLNGLSLTVGTTSSNIDTRFAYTSRTSGSYPIICMVHPQ